MRCASFSPRSVCSAWTAEAAGADTRSRFIRRIAGEDTDYIGTARVEGSMLYMRQFVASTNTTVRQLLLGLLSTSMRRAGAELTAAETAAEQDSSEASGLRYAEAVTHWQELGGYAEEAA